MRNSLRLSSSPQYQSCTCMLSKITYGSKAAPLIKRQRQIHTYSSPKDAYYPTALDSSRQLAQLRARESERPSPLLNDPYAQKLIETSSNSSPENDANHLEVTAAFDLIAARFVDDQLLLASSNVNANRNQEYNQIVIIGDGYCTRPFRLPWPSGTVIYMVALGEVHERAEALLADVPARVPRGCLLRRVDCSFTEGSSFAAALQRAGYRPDRLSVWGLQGIRSLNLSQGSLSSIFADISNLAALESIIIGELPHTVPADVDNLLASFGLLGTSFEPEDVAKYIEPDEVKSWWHHALIERSRETKEFQRSLLFRAQQRRLSLLEIEVYEAHVAAAEEVDEDFFGNFS